MTYTPDICIYHGNCADGFTAAWAIHKRWPNIEFFSGIYGNPTPDVKNKRVLMVDFSYKSPVLLEMLKEAYDITIIDHHETAQKDLEPLLKSGQIGGKFDMTHSGAYLAWQFAHGTLPIPSLVLYVEDRDLWKFKLPNSREINASIFSYDYTFENWDKMDMLLKMSKQTLITEGAAIERKHFKDVKELLANTVRIMKIGGVKVKVANFSYTMASDAANMLSADAPFGACYYDRSDGQRIFSLRSKEDGANVADIAALYGGGGHAHAAGFQAAPGWEGDDD